MSELDGLLERLFTTPPPVDVQRKARLLTLDTLGCALAGFEEPKLARLRAALGRDDAAVAFAIAACWHEACEGLARAHGRPGVAVIAACIELGMRHDVVLGEFIESMITGYEVGGRMGEMLRMRPGMHVDASWPALGVAAGAVRLLRGTSEQARAAIELAACQLPYSLYLPVEQGADGRNTYLGHAAWLGIYAAQAVLAGCDAPAGAVERFAVLALDRPALELAAAGDYVIREAYLKPFAAVRHVHYGAGAALRLRERILDTRKISAVSLLVYPEALTYCGNRSPRTPIQAQFSLSFGIAAALRYGRLDAEQYAEPAFSDPELRRLEGLVQIDADARAEGRSATLRLTVDGRALEERVSVVKGDPGCPMTEAECRDKFMRNATRRLAAPAARAIAQALLEGAERQPLKTILQEAIRT